MWETFYSGISTSLPIFAMGIFMVVFSLAIVRSLRKNDADEGLAAQPLHDSMSLVASSSDADSVHPNLNSSAERAGN